MNDGNHSNLGIFLCSWGRLRLSDNGLFKESRPNSLGFNPSNWLFDSIIHNRPASDCFGTIPTPSRLPAIRWSDGDS